MASASWCQRQQPASLPWGRELRHGASAAHIAQAQQAGSTAVARALLGALPSLAVPAKDPADAVKTIRKCAWSGEGISEMICWLLE